MKLEGIFSPIPTDHRGQIDLLRSLMKGEVRELLNPYTSENFDARNDTDILIGSFRKGILIGGGSVAKKNLTPPFSEVSWHYELLGRPDLFLYFAIYDGFTYGLSVIQNGAVVRSRYHNYYDIVIEHGTPEDYEVEWIEAPIHLDIPYDEDSQISTLQNGEWAHTSTLTRVIANSAIKNYFDVDLIRDEDPISFRYFRKIEL